MTTKIQEIHAGKLFGIFSETGCSGGTANALMNEPGSSRTVDFAIQPYNKNREVERYGRGVEATAVGKEPMWERSVSIHYVDRVLEIEERNMTPEDNFVFASSWQLDGVCHGWIGLYVGEHGKGTRHYLHYTIFSTESSEPRGFLLECISKIGVELLHSATIDPTLKGFKHSSTALYPAILDMAYVEMNLDYELVIGSLEACDHDYPLVFEDGGMIRLEELSRRSNDQVIVKGSFNPMHQAHKDMADMTRAMYPGSTASLLISTARYDKPHIDTDELHDRIKFINNHGYPLIVVKEIFFYRTFNMMMSWMPGHKFYWPVGTDTLNRIYEADKKAAAELYIDDVDFYVNNVISRIDVKKNVFLHYNRENNVLNSKVLELYKDVIIDVVEYVDDGVSSSKIRTGEMKNDIDRE